MSADEMKMITRVQRSRQHKSPPKTKYCGRTSKLGNPYHVICLDKKNNLWYVENQDTGYKSRQITGHANANTHAVDMYKIWLPGTGIDVRAACAGYAYLSCFCPLDLPCHVDYLITLIEDVL